MTLVAAPAPATTPQIRALQAEFRRLGYPSREQRLTAAAGALGMEALSSFTDLTYGQAGFLFGWLRHLDRHGHPPAPARDEDQPHHEPAAWRHQALPAPGAWRLDAGPGQDPGDSLRPAAGVAVCALAAAALAVIAAAGQLAARWRLLAGQPE